jgi:hypothetical protein
MAQSGVDESVIVSYINNSGTPFNLTSDQIIYLKDLGLPNDAVTAMMQRDQQLGVTATAQTPTATANPPTTETTAEQPTEVTQNYFYDSLSPYGGWVNVSGYGLCWRPTVGTYDSGWQPYCQHGHWIYTDAGWYWLSDYSWGSCTFHYGRWFHDTHFGWCWWPETTWAPSWVCWRYSSDYCGWAPLPPRCIFRPGVGIVFNGAVVSAGFDFGIGANFFTFVPTRNFCDLHPDRFRVKRDTAVNVFNHTTIVNNFNEDSRNHFIVNNGISRDKIAAVSKTPIRQVAIRDAGSSGFHGERLQRAGNTIVVNRPQISANVAATLNNGVRPQIVRQNTPHPLILNGNGNNHPSTPQNHVPQNQNNFQPAPNQNSRPNHNEVAPQTQNFGQPAVPRVVTPQPQPHNNNSAPIQEPAKSTGYVSVPETPNYNRAMSPRSRQEFEQQPPHYNSRSTSSTATEPRTPPQTSTPSSPSKSDHDKVNGSGH